MSRCPAFALALALLGCKVERIPSPPRHPAASVPPSSPRVRLAGATARPTDLAAPPVCAAGVDRIEAAEKAFDERSYALALSCAEEALLDDPESAPAEHERAAALAALGKTDDARLAYAHALALDPDDPQILLGAADLYLSRGGGREDEEIALAYARHGERRARRRHPELVGQLDLLQGMALNDLGRSAEALAELDAALAHEPRDLDARYERGVALFELCRFAEARTELGGVLQALPDDAYAHHELGLVLERLGDARGASAQLARATELAPKAFPAQLPVGRAEFDRLVASAIAALPPEAHRDLKGTPVSVQELPDVADLTVDDPPLSPTILGLFRGEPLGDAGAVDGGAAPEARAIVIYRENLLRAVRSHDELETQVRITLLHELGHLRGADDDELRLQGLE